jgi:hypothetical protein
MLLGNYSVLNKSPGMFLGGSTTSVEPKVRSAFGKSGANRNRFFVDSLTTALSLYSVPEGCYVGKAWILPQKSGSISGQNSTFLTFGGTGAGSKGRNITGTTALTFGASGTGGLISSASGSASLTMGVTGALFASKAVIGTSGISMAAMGAITAKGNIGAVAGITLHASWTPYAVGWISGTTAESGLTPTGIANAVWQKVIEAGYSADQILRLLAAHSAGAATGLEGANPQFMGLDGVTTRIDGTYSAGTRTIDSLNGS